MTGETTPPNGNNGTDDDDEGKDRDDQLGINFDPPRARNTDPDTSHDAAHIMRESGLAKGQRRQVILALGVEPMHSFGVDQYYGWRDASASRRMTEVRNAGCSEKTGEKRKTVGNCTGHVHRLTELGREVHQKILELQDD